MKQKANNTFVQAMELNQQTFSEDINEKGRIYEALEDLGIKFIHISTMIMQIFLISLVTYALWCLTTPVLGILAGTITSVYAIAKM